nr:D-2-hydroxyglutarate dehydrogenase, mitochondrial [Tanacetum cinerariifolium]
EKLEAFLLHAMEVGLISDGAIAQDSSQASSFSHIRERILKPQRMLKPQRVQKSQKMQKPAGSEEEFHDQYYNEC